MGYMGFGMRKEVYQRKPKRAFENIRKAYEKESKAFHSGKLELKNNKLDENLKKRIRDRIHREERNRLSLVVIVSLLIFIGLGLLVRIYVKDYFEQKEKYKQKNKTARYIYKRKQLVEDGKVYMIVDYFVNGGIASSFRIKDGHKHQNSESYYLTGEQFRSALYYYDTLVNEYYFFKDGDTIHHFPKINPNLITRVRLEHPGKSSIIQFQIVDYKIVPGSYEQISRQTFIVDE